MTFQRRKVAVATACALGLSGGVVGSIASAADVRVDVTGTNIKRVDTEGPAPVAIITREEIERRGSTTVAEILRALPAQGGFTFDDQFTNGFAPGSSGIGLRNLGQNATLVLVNGRRVANYGFAQNIDLAFVDLNSIPVGAIERIEVLKDGASAIYGSDAIAGVINIIMRKDFRGVEATASYGVTQRSDGDETRASVVAGFGDLAKDRYNAMVVVDYYKREPIYYGDRSYSHNANMEDRGGFDFRSPTGSPGTYIRRPNTDPGFTGAVPFPTCAPGDIRQRAAGGLECAFNFNPFITGIPETERKAVFGRFAWDITPNFQFFFEGSYNLNDTKTSAAPTPGGFILPVGHNSNPYPTPVQIAYRFLDAGPRLDDIETETTRLLAGLRGNFRSWDWEVGALLSKSDTENNRSNYLSLSEVNQLVSRGVYNFLDPSRNSPELVNSLKIPVYRIGESEMRLFDAKASGPIFNLPAGPVQLAVGAEYREDEITDRPDPNTLAGNVVGSGGTASAGKRDLTSLFAEFSIPLHRTLEAQLAVRYDDYSDFGSTTNPKVALRWQPTKNLLVRGSYGEGFRAPSLVELYLGETTSFVSFVDQPRCDAYRAGGGTATEVTAACRPVQRRTVSGGNPGLLPETSDSWFVGAIWEPLDNLTLELDYWRIDHKNIIDQPLIGFQVENPQSFPGTIFRQDPNARDVAVGAPGALRGEDSGDLQPGVRRTYFNIAKQEAEGIDFGATLRSNLGTWGRLTSSVAGTYNIHYKFAPSPGEPLAEYNGTYYYPRWRANATFDWERGPWNFTTFLNYTHHYYQINGIAGGSCCDYVDSWTTTDVQLQYKGFKNWTLAFGIKNLFDNDPPFSDDETQGFDFTTHNPVGRFYYGRVKYTFN
jgi:iron complex outermembrane recepter protein